MGIDKLISSMVVLIIIIIKQRGSAPMPEWMMDIIYGKPEPESEEE